MLAGTNTSLIKKEILAEPCMYCGQVNAVNMQVLQRYFHFLWIPFFPLNKPGLTICMHCKKINRHPEFPDSYNLFYAHVKLQSRTPWWVFSGSVFALLLAGFLIFSIRDSYSRYAKLIQEAKSGDLYTVKTDDNKYRLYKVQRVKNDSVFVSFSQTDVSKSKYTKYILARGPDAFANEEFGFTKKLLLRQLNERTLLSVRRP